MDAPRPINASKLGYYLDGWADLIEGNGEKTTEVGEEVISQLVAREMPEIQVDRARIKEGYLSMGTRDYTITTTYPGVTDIVYISKHGKDLFASWRCFIRPTLNWHLLAIYGGISLAIGVIGSVLWTFQTSVEIIKFITNSQYWKSFTKASSDWLMYALIILICEVVILVVAGRIIKQNERAYLTPSNIAFAIIIALVLGLSIEGVGKTLSQSISGTYSLLRANMFPFYQPFVVLFGIALNTFVLIILGAIVYGLINRRNLLAYILKDPSIFDADDITAMNLSVHKSVLRALDKAGIDTEKLRLKTSFKGGRREETI